MAETNAVSDADAIAAAAVRLAGERGWRNLPLDDIAAEAGVSPEVLMGNYLCRPEILDGFERMIDRRMLAGAIAGFLKARPTWAMVQRWLMASVLAGMAVRLAAQSRR